MSALRDAVDPLDRDYFLIDHVQDEVGADAQPVVPATMKSLSWIGVIGQVFHCFHDRPHADLVTHEPAR
jgi:hypothetical protein